MSRPRDAARGAAIIAAAAALLDEVGFETLTIEAVALRAGVGRPTIYRRWSSKAELVLAVMQERFSEARGSGFESPVVPPSTGSLRGDLIDVVAKLVHSFESMMPSGAMGGIAAEMTSNPSFSTDVQSTWLNRDAAGLAAIITTAVDRGEARPDVAGREILEMLTGAVFYRLVVLHRSCPPAWQHHLVDLAIRGAQPSYAQPPA